MTDFQRMQQRIIDEALAVVKREAEDRADTAILHERLPALLTDSVEAMNECRQRKA